MAQSSTQSNIQWGMLKCEAAISYFLAQTNRHVRDNDTVMNSQSDFDLVVSKNHGNFQCTG